MSCRFFRNPVRVGSTSRSGLKILAFSPRLNHPSIACTYITFGGQQCADPHTRRNFPLPLECPSALRPSPPPLRPARKSRSLMLGGAGGRVAEASRRKRAVWPTTRRCRPPQFGGAGAGARGRPHASHPAWPSLAHEDASGPSLWAPLPRRFDSVQGN